MRTHGVSHSDLFLPGGAHNAPVSLCQPYGHKVQLPSLGPPQPSSSCPMLHGRQGMHRAVPGAERPWISHQLTAVCGLYLPTSHAAHVPALAFPQPER